MKTGQCQYDREMSCSLFTHLIFFQLFYRFPISSALTADVFYLHCLDEMHIPVELLQLLINKIMLTSLN